jgi:minor extracellular serine protease Vpr
MLRSRAVVVALACAFVVGACGSSSPTEKPTETPTAGPPTPLATETSPGSQPTPTPISSSGANPSATPQASASASSGPGGTPTAAPVSATGAGVTIVIFDRGIDWRNPEFLNADGTTRIKAALDMSGQNWCADGNPAPTAYTQDDINAALAGTRQIGLRDAVGHGTATAGLAAGNGSSLPDGRYAGVAPDADLVIVKVTSEGAPAHGDQPAEAAFNGCMDDALAWAKGQIEALGQPVVGIWNAGTQWGPIDGSSATSRAIARLFPPDKPGWVWVASSGDEGGIPNHAGADYAAGSPAVIHFGLTGDSSYPSAWYTGSAPATVTVELGDGTKVGPVAPGDSASAGGVTVTQYAPGKEFYPWTSNSGDHAVWLNISGHNGQGGTITFTATGSKSGHVDVYGDVLGPQPLTSAINFSDALVDGRLNDVSSTPGAIVVADYVALDHFTDVNGANEDFSQEGVAGALWYRSSGGPTRDGRDVVDVAAAGQNVPAPLAAGSWWSDPSFSSLWPQDGQGLYIRFGGTSAAGPIVAGTIALMLEVNPSLTADQVRDLLHQTATSDSFTGAVPNADWGYGKLDIQAAVAAAPADAGPAF